MRPSGKSSFSRLAMAVCLLFVWGVEGYADDRAALTSGMKTPPRLHTVFDQKTMKEFPELVEAFGKVEHNPNSIDLFDGSRLKVGLADRGRWARIEFDIAPKKDDGGLRIRFQSSDSQAEVILSRSRVPSGPGTNLEIRFSSSSVEAASLIREATLRGKDINDVSIEIRAGFIEIRFQNQPELSAWLEDFTEPIKAIHIDHLSGSIRFKSFSVAASNALTAQQKEDLGRCNQLSKSLDSAMKAGRLSEAETQSEEILTIRRDQYGNAHPRVATNILNHAMIKLESSKYREAQILFEEGRRILSKSVDTTDSRYITACVWLGKACTKNDDLAKAKEVYLETLRLRKAVEGVNTTAYASNLYNLGSVHEKLGSADEALDAYLKTAEIEERVLGRKSESLSSTYRSIADLYSTRKEYEAAAVFYDKAIAIRREKLGVGHSLTVSASMAAARMFATAKNYPQAERRFVELLSHLEDRPDHPAESLAAIQFVLGDTYEDWGRPEEAIACYEKAARAQERAAGSQNSRYADYLLSLGRVCQKTSQWSRAESAFRRNLEIRRAHEKTPGRDLARAISVLASLLTDIKKADEAESLYLQAVDVLKGLPNPDPKLTAATFGNLALHYKSNSEFRKSEAAFEEARKELDGLPANQTHATLLAGYAILLRDMKQYSKAEPVLRERLRIQTAVSGKNSDRRAKAMSALAQLYCRMERYADAIPLYEESVEIRRSTGQGPASLSVTLHNLATTYEKALDHVRARQTYEEALAGKEDTRSVSYASTLSNLSGVCHKLGDLQAAESRGRQAVEILESLGSVAAPEFAESLNSLSMVYSAMGRFERVEPLLRKSAEIRRKHFGRMHAFYATSLNNLASHHFQMGDTAQAVTVMKEVVEISEKVHGQGTPRHLAYLNNLGAIYEANGRTLDAFSLYEKIRVAQQSLLGRDHPHYAATTQKMANIAHKMRDLATAKKLLAECLLINSKRQQQAPRGYAANLFDIATIHEDLGEYEEAIRLCEQSLSIRRAVQSRIHPEFSTTIKKLAVLNWMNGEVAAATDLFQEQHANMVEAAEYVLPTTSLAEAIIWTDKHRPPVDYLLAVFRDAKPASTRTAYSAVWESKLLTTRLRPNQTTSNSLSSASRNVAQELKKVRMQLAQTVTDTAISDSDRRRKLTEHTQNKELLEKRLSRLNAPSARTLAVRDASIDDLFQAIPEGVAVVDIVQVKDRQLLTQKNVFQIKSGEYVALDVQKPSDRLVYEAFILRNNANDQVLEWVSLGSASKINAAIKGFQRRVRHKSGTPTEQQLLGLEKAARQLRQLLWTPIATHLGDCHSVVLLPDGMLHKLSWAALPGRRPDSFLIEDYRICVAPSGQHISWLLTAPELKSSGLCVIGGVDYGSGSVLKNPALSTGTADRWNDLPGTRDEAKSIASVWSEYQKANASLLTGTDADESSVSATMRTKRYVHLATHGFFEIGTDIYQTNLRQQGLFANSESSNLFQMTSSLPGNSLAERNPLVMIGIVLANANHRRVRSNAEIGTDSDGILTAEEIAGLDFQEMDLATLSACETGLGDDFTGEGSFGLRRVLHDAGARSVIASLWKVDDRATQELMKRFYTNLWIKKQSKIDALRNAQLWMLNHPKELAEMGVKNPTTRGTVRDTKPAADPETNPRNNSERTSPYFWAPWVLSGDWR